MNEQFDFEIVTANFLEKQDLDDDHASIKIEVEVVHNDELILFQLPLLEENCTLEELRWSMEEEVTHEMIKEYVRSSVNFLIGMRNGLGRDRERSWENYSRFISNAVIGR